MVEYVHVQTNCVTFLVFASHAGTDFRESIAMQEKYRHVDMNFVDIKCLDAYKGPLPELWGLLPRSPQVEEMVIAPSKRRAKAESTVSRCDGLEGSCSARAAVH